MIIDAASGLRGVLINADTGERIPHARWANLETGEWEALASTPDGRRPLAPRRLVRGRCRLRFVPAPAVAAPPQGTGAGAPPTPAWQSPPGARGRVSTTWGRLQFVWPTCLCEHKGCERPANWLTCDEEEQEPERMPDGTLAERATISKRHYWCDYHFTPPLFTSRRGVTSEVDVAARPQ